MVALMSRAKTGELIPINIGSMCFMMLQAQYLEAIEVDYYFQIGINLDYFHAEPTTV